MGRTLVRIGSDTVRSELAEMLGVTAGDVDEDADLFELGLQSLQLMRLAARLQRDGLRVTFAELAASPTLAAWCPLLDGGAAGSEVEPARTDPATDPATDRTEDRPFPLTAVQQAYWIGRRDDQPLGGVGCHAYLELAAGVVDPDRLEAAVRTVLACHPMLRARFDEEGHQQILPVSPWAGLTVHDLRDRNADGARDGLATIRDGMSHRRYDVAVGSVLDVALTLLPRYTSRVHVGVDLLVADVHSIRTLLDELAAAYVRPSRAPEPAASFADHLPVAAPEAAAAARAYWAGRMADLPSGPPLPLAVDPATVTRPRFRRRVRTLDPDTWGRLRARARAHGITASVLLATAFAEVLARWSGSRRFLLNVPLFDRDQGVPGLDRVVGDFTSLVLLEIDLDAADSFTGRLRAVQSRLHRDIGHAAHTGVQVLRDLARADGDAPRTAPVVFACNIDAPLVSDRCARVLGEQAWMVSQTPQVWLDHQLYPTRDGGLQLAWDAVEDLFRPGVVDHMLDAYHALLRRLVDDDWSSAPEIPLPAGQLTVRDAVNSSTRTQSGLRLHDRFFERASRTPDAPALLSGGRAECRYGELAERALRIGGALTARGVGRGDTVVVTLPKGPDQIAAVLGVLAAGAAYVPVGVGQPAARRARIAGLSGARCVLTGPGDTDGVRDEAVLGVAEALTCPPLPAPVPGDPSDLAYVIFTSGSTGVPKGVEIDHRAAVNTVEDVDERFGVGAADRVLALSALDFDLSVWDVFGLLGAGGALVLVDEADRRDAREWLRLCAAHGVTVWNSVPALLEMLLVAADGDPLPPSLRLALVSGDWVGPALPDRWARATAGRGRLVALGGATEGAIWSNAHEVDPASGLDASWVSVPYGLPLSDQRYRVVDPAGRDCPDWVVGELWIGGAGVALGYRGAPELTAERFVHHGGSRWYRTGDLGRYRPDGLLEFLGRVDHQVKVNGNRVELGEVESVLATHPEVAGAVAITAGPAGGELHAAVVARPPAVAPAALVVGCDGDADHLVTDELATTVLAGLVAGAVGDGSDRAAVGAAFPGVPHDVLDGWLDHLTGRDVLASGDGGHTLAPGPCLAAVPARADRLADRAGRARALVDEVLRARPLFAMVAAGTVGSPVLLDDPALSPGGLADTMAGAPECLAAAVRELTSCGALRTVDPTAGRGRTAERLMRAADGLLELDHTVLVRSPADLAAAGARLAAAPGRSRVALRPGTAVAPEHLHAYDAVVTTGLFDEPGAPAAVAALLRRGGILLTVERSRRAPLGLLLDGLGTGAVPPRPDPAGWASALAAAGLDEARVVHAAPGGCLLLAAHRPADAPASDSATLTAWLAERLPEHMVPRAIVALPELPLSANGKVDRREVAATLAGAVTTTPAADGEQPRGPVELAVARLWTDVLGVPAPGRADTFFTLGGDSLLATRLVARIRAELGVELTMRDVLRRPTLTAMAADVAARLPDPPGPDGRAAVMEEGEL